MPLASAGGTSYPSYSMDRALRFFRELLDRQSKLAIGILGLIGLVGVAVLDLVTGNELAFSFFYLVPITTVAWFGSPVVAILMGIAGGVAFPVTQAINGEVYEGAWVPGWNFAVRAATYSTVVILASRLRRSLDHERALSRTDSLTGANPRHFYEAAQLELVRASRSGRPLTIAYLDVDNFKLVNDDYGHAAGDDLLRFVADTLAAATRPVDLVGRLGGDEFALLLPETGSREAMRVLNRVHHVLGEAVGSSGYSATTSMGAVTFNQTPATVDELLWPADQLLYAVKRDAKNHFRHKTIGGDDLQQIERPL